MTDSRFLLWEAQQAHYYGLPHNLALAAVTSTPAGVLGQDHRIGYIKEGLCFLTLSASSRLTRHHTQATTPVRFVHLSHS